MISQNSHLSDTFKTKSKTGIRNRLLSSVFMTIYLIGMFIFVILSDKIYLKNDSERWLKLPDLVTKIFSILFLIYILPLVMISAKEICNIFYRFSWFSYTLVFICMFSLSYAPTLVYFLKIYMNISLEIGSGDGNAIPGLNLTTVFSIVLACCIVLTVIINTILLIYKDELNFKNWVIVNFLVGIVSGFFLSLFFFVFQRGWITLLFLFLITISNDSFAFFGGVLLGKHKMAPKISPKKTWEGFASGILITLILASILMVGLSFATNPYNIIGNIWGVQMVPVANVIKYKDIANNILRVDAVWWVCIIIIIIALCGISVLGDLCFSWFKRKYYIKDYGTLIPGHGGIIDRIDSHSFVLSTWFIINLLIPLFLGNTTFSDNSLIIDTGVLAF